MTSQSQSVSNRVVIALFLVVLPGMILADSLSAECKARACLESPYGPGIAPGCAGALIQIQNDIVHGRGLPVCETATRDYSSGWYWRANGWENCPIDTSADSAAECGRYAEETLPEFIAFDAGTALMTTEGKQVIEDIAARLKNKDIRVRIIGISSSRAGYASKNLAQDRAEVTTRLLTSAGVDALIKNEIRTLNWETTRPLLHGVWVLAVGRGLAANQTITGKQNKIGSDCGLIVIRVGSLKDSLVNSVRYCGYEVRRWPIDDGDLLDYIETRDQTKQVRGYVEDVLEFFADTYGLSYRIDDYEIDIFQTK